MRSPPDTAWCRLLEALVVPGCFAIREWNLTDLRAIEQFK
jgi:hypothetical protein